LDICIEDEQLKTLEITQEYDSPRSYRQGEGTVEFDKTRINNRPMFGNRRNMSMSKVIDES
jgi:hypothetical protein